LAQRDQLYLCFPSVRAPWSSLLLGAIQPQTVQLNKICKFSNSLKIYCFYLRMSFKRKGSRRNTFVPGKMDTARAQSLLGFTSNRWMDATAGNDPKVLLDQALDAQMQKATQRKAMKSAKEKVYFLCHDCPTNINLVYSNVKCVLLTKKSWSMS